MKKAILFGASGFIGSHLLRELLDNDDYDQVAIVIRKDLEITHPKLTTLIGDYHALPQLIENISVDEIFITLGTTKKHTPDKREYYQVDHDYPVMAAKTAKEHGATSVFVVTAIGANSNSGIFYSKTKGDTERDILALDFDHTHIFEPSIIMGDRKEHRTAEKLFINLFRIVNPLLLGRFKKYKGMDGKDIARAINNAAKNQTEKVKIYRWSEMNSLL